MNNRPVGRARGRFTSLTPEIDKRQEYWENVVALGLDQVARCERARSTVRQAIEERKVLCVDFEPRRHTDPQPCRAA